MVSGPSTGLLEREHELEELDRLMDDAAGGRGGLVVVEGPAGIGKTRLLEVTRDHAQSAGFSQLGARGGILEGSHPYGVTRALLAPVIGARLGSEEITDILGPAAPLFDSRLGPLAGEVGEPSFPVLVALCQVVLTAAEERPLVVCVDDAHWSDSESLRFLSALTGMVATAAVLVIVALRRHEPGAPNELLGQLVAHSTTHHLSPEPLSSYAVATLLDTELGSAPAPEFLVAFVGATGGNPFLCTELARSLAAEGMTPSADHAERLAGLAPAAVARSVLPRIAMLPEEARRASAALAVIGGEGSWRLVAALTELEHDPLSRAFDMLANAGVVRHAAVPEFLHPMIRTAIYEDLPISQRDRDHHRVAELLAQSPAAHEDEIATHLLLTRPRGERWVAERLGRAGARALDQGAAATAAAYLRRALEESPDGDLGVRLLADLGDAESRQGNSTAAANALRAALQQTSDPVRRGQLAIPLALALTRTGRAADGMETLQDAVANLPDDAIELGQAIETEIEVIAHLNGQAGRQVRGRGLRFARPAKTDATPEGQRLAFAGRADIEMNRGGASAAAKLALVALEDGELMRQEGAGIVLFFSTAIVLLYCDHLDDAERIYSEAAINAEERGQRLTAASARGFLAGVHLRRGALPRARSEAQASLGATVSTGDILRTTFAGAFLIEALVDQGELGHATRTLELLRAQGPFPDALIVNVLQHARGRLRSASHDHRRALADHIECGRRAADWDMQSPSVANWRSLAAAEYAALGSEDEAHRHAGAGTECARKFGSPRAIGMALTIEGQITGDLERLHEAVEVLRASLARLEYARALVALGSAHRRAGQRIVACEALREGLGLARVCGAVPLARAADEELVVLGSRTRRVTRAGVGTLTASEHRVAALAAGGYSNQQIADALVLSIRTVETHLAHCYQKLGIAGRREIAAVLEPGVSPSEHGMPVASDSPVRSA